jgi:hypothetical protein
MRTFLPPILACFALASVMGGWLIVAAVAGGQPAGSRAEASAPPAPAQKPAPASAGSSIDNEAPARHARRTACLKDAKTKKMVGAKRTAYVKNCMGAS